MTLICDFDDSAVNPGRNFSVALTGFRPYTGRSWYSSLIPLSLILPRGIDLRRKVCRNLGFRI